MVILGVLLTPFVSAAEDRTPTSHQSAYLAGIEYFEQGQFLAASESFRGAINLSPSPSAGPDEYLPYIYLSATEYEIGNTIGARDALIQSQVHGTAPKTDTGKHLLGLYAADIMSAPLRSREHVSAAAIDGAVDGGAELDSNLHPGEKSVASKILKRCIGAAKNEELPWYFHYKCGVDLMQAGEAQRAVEAFQMGANAREDSSRGKRMYGMWYIDYLPYYQIALAQSKLGDWQSARAAIIMSSKFGEFSPMDPDYGSFLELDELIRENLEHSES